jgi:hypothetical protein
MKGKQDVQSALNTANGAINDVIKKQDLAGSGPGA